jgi:hypothetical protein
MKKKERVSTKISKSKKRAAIAKIKKKKALKPSKKVKRSLYLEKVDWGKVEKIFATDKSLLLKALKENKKHFPYTKDILKLLAAGAIIGLSLYFPTLPAILAPFIVDGKKFKRYRLNQTIKRLEKQKLVKIAYQDDQVLVKITHKGRMRALKYKLSEIEVERPKRWDKKWRIVIFDIAEKYRSARDVFRERLKSMNFYQLQESVWVHAFPCFDQIEFLRQIYKVGVSVRYIIAHDIEDVDDLLEHFELK